MNQFSRRSLLHASLGLAAAGTLARPYIANAAAKTATIWWTQGFVPNEDIAFRKLVADYEKASGNTIELTIVPFAPLRQKIISAITSGVVPDLVPSTPLELVALQAWQGNLVDVTDVVEPAKSRYVPAALQTAYCYNAKEKQRSYYGVPILGGTTPFHIWKDLVEKAGYKISDLPNTWDAFIDFFNPVQEKLRAQGMRHVYANGFVVSTIGNDPNITFHHFLIAYGGKDIVTPDGKLHSDDPQVRAAAIKVLTKLASLFKDGHIPSNSVNWNDADDNNAFHSKLVVMDFDGTLSTEMAMIKNKQAYNVDMLTHGLPLSNEGKPVESIFLTAPVLIPNGAKNVAVAKDFLKFAIQPQANTALVKGGLGRSLPVFPAQLREDPWWRDPKIDPHRPVYAQQGLGPTMPYYYAFNPAYAQVMTEHVWNVAWADIVTGGMKPEQAADKAWKRIETIFAKYPIQQS
ncbi:MAG TPA: ABC transporter substrate-binding protein [Stellaceae bacterium]|nr:ABC transporter substrate-binding protein [Stellaceae bacterium]